MKGNNNVYIIDICLCNTSNDICLFRLFNNQFVKEEKWKIKTFIRNYRL